MQSFGSHGGGGIGKILGIVFLLIGAYALVTFLGIISFDIPFLSAYLLPACAIGSFIGGIFMLVKK